MSRRSARREGFLVAALWVLVLAWIFATSAWELPDLTPPHVYAGGAH